MQSFKDFEHLFALLRCQIQFVNVFKYPYSREVKIGHCQHKANISIQSISKIIFSARCNFWRQDARIFQGCFFCVCDDRIMELLLKKHMFFPISGATASHTFKREFQKTLKMNRDSRESRDVLKAMERKANSPKKAEQQRKRVQETSSAMQCLTLTAGTYYYILMPFDGNCRGNATFVP